MRFREIIEDVWHGTSHRFDKFDTDKIGTGEGNAVYGWGLYFTSTQEVAHIYRRQQSRNEEAIANQAVSLGISPANAYAVAEAYMGGMTFERFESETMASHTAPQIEHFRAALRQELDTIRTAWPRLGDVGHIYHVEIPEEGAYLLWDAPLSKQPPAVSAALSSIVQAEGPWGLQWQDATLKLCGTLVVNGEKQSYDRWLAEVRGVSDYGDDEWAVYYPWGSGRGTHNRYQEAMAVAERTVRERLGQQVDEPTGRTFYETLTTVEGSDKNASLFLLAHGIPGIKYLDGNSRSAGSGTFNYVLFDASLARVKKRT